MQRDAGRMAGPALDPGYDGDLVPCRVVMRQRGRFATMIKIQSLIPVDWRALAAGDLQRRVSGPAADGDQRPGSLGRTADRPRFRPGRGDRTDRLLGVLRPRATASWWRWSAGTRTCEPGDRSSPRASPRSGRAPTTRAARALTPRGFPGGHRGRGHRRPRTRSSRRSSSTPAASFDFNETVFVVTPLGAGPDTAGAAGEGSSCAPTLLWMLVAFVGEHHGRAPDRHQGRWPRISRSSPW